MAEIDPPFGPSELASARDALSIMKAWRWVHYNPDGEPSASSMDLATAVNRLAFDGHAAPNAAILTLFATDQVEVRGDFVWRKLQNGQMFSLNGAQTSIPANRWIRLRESLIQRETTRGTSNWTAAKLELPKLGYSDQPIADWEPKYNRMSYASRMGEDEWTTPNYHEELFDAKCLAIFPLALPGPDGEIVGIADEANEAEALDDVNDVKRGRKPKYDWPAATLAIFGMIYRGDLKPELQADIERALIDHLTLGDSAPSESTARPYAKLIWDEYSKA